jgi:hypothetical protein
MLSSRSGPVVQRADPEQSELTGGGLGMGLATSLLSFLRGASLDHAAVHGLMAMGVRDEKDLTNLLFWARHPESALRRIEPGQTALAAEWVQIRNTIVRPILRAGDEKDDRGKTGPTEPAGDDKTEPASDGIGADRLGDYGDPAATRFRREVYASQLERARKTKEFFPGLPPAELDTVEDSHRMHVDAAGDARSLFAAARAELASDRAAGDAAALTVSSIGIGSAYRDPERDFSAWKNAFNTHYNATADTRAGLEGGAFGPAAVSLLVKRMVKKKAVPGFSNHTKGLAIDFRTKQGKWTFGASSAQSAGWVNTWLYRWLAANAATYNFQPYSAEPWHWDHRT